jgi:hypothetical protein
MEVMMKKKVVKHWVLMLGVGVFFAAACSVQAEESNYPIGKIGAAELRIGLGPRPNGMGECFAALLK